MDALPIVFFLGDPYRCERALAERQQALHAADPTVERQARFADEVDVASFDMELQSAPLFALGRHFVVRAVDKTRKPKPWAELAAKDLPAGTYVSFLATPDVKSSHPVVKACAARGAVVSLPSPAARGIAQTARGVLAECGLRASSAALESLVARTGGDLLALASEARKLRAYAGAREVDEDDIASLVFPGGEPTAYPFFDRLGERDLPGALRALDELRDDPGRILGGAIRHMTRITTLCVLLRQRVSPSQMADLVSLPDWLLRRLLGQARRFRLEEATAALDLGISLDTEVKSGGRSAIDALLEFVFSVTSPVPPTARG
jgi:DNA polymerase-3 subunit delta